MKYKILTRMVLLIIFELCFYARYSYIDASLLAIKGMKSAYKTFEQYVIQDLMVYFFISSVLCAMIELFIIPKFNRKIS